jgi:hypothetical protein
VELRTAITSENKRTNLQDPEEDHRAGICEARKQDAQRVAEGEKQDLVAGSAPSGARRIGLDFVDGLIPSETEKNTAHRAGSDNVETSTTWDSFAPTAREREREIVEDDEPGLIEP